ncbi:MAG: hypothetical protein LBQ19_04055, partial [Synergistaceae bacterium]|jgi:hypothetical protein|nr:hypothetical protein [Synergistaceae bacterium]
MKNMKRITVSKPFTYYIDGYDRRDFVIGEHDVPYDCAAYAEEYGFTKKKEGEKDDGTDKPVGSKKTPAG